MDNRLFKDMRESNLSGTRVKVAKEGDKKMKIEKAIQLFKRRVKESGKIVELKRRQEFKKKSTVRREMMNAAVRKQRLNSINDDF